jgi:small multidrug resistance pump
MPVGAAYATRAGTGVALTALLGWANFGERMTLTMILGLVLIAGGVALTELGGREE